VETIREKRRNNLLNSKRHRKQVKERKRNGLVESRYRYKKVSSRPVCGSKKAIVGNVVLKDENLDE